MDVSVAAAPGAKLGDEPGERTFEAIVVDLDGCRLGDGEAAVLERVEALSSLGVHVFILPGVEVTGLVTRLLGIAPGRAALHLPAGPKPEAVRLAKTWLADRGITGALVLKVEGDEACPARLVELLDIQLARRRARRVPDIDPDPAWTLALPEDPALERVAESLGTLANGWAAVRAAREEDGAGTGPLFQVGGVYTEGNELLPGPRWAELPFRSRAGASASRLLDMHTGVLRRVGSRGTDLHSLRFVSAARPSALALRAEAPASRLGNRQTLASPGEGSAYQRSSRDGVKLGRTGNRNGGGIIVAARDKVTLDADQRRTERLAVWAADEERVPKWEIALDGLEELERVGFDALLAEHREAWAQRWADAEVTIEGDAGAQLAARFAVFSLLSVAPDSGEAAVGARGLTGPAYGGHVFWDADVFVLPALAAIRPSAARAMLEYRIRRLPAARASATALGRAGARFPWESAVDGSDVTPRQVRGTGGQLIPIRTGDHEEHISADVAWAAMTYASWSGDDAFLDGPGSGLLIDTARYWASCARRDREGRAHLYGMMGPDEYHEVVDDNAFTNLMARWNLRAAADLAGRLRLDRGEAKQWRRLAQDLVDGWDPGLGLYEQFAGYFGLEPLLIAELGPRPVAADILLGADRVAASQIIKQADVLMAHHLLPDEVVAGSLSANLAYYEPRTAHGSSLSPAIHASLLARAGRPEAALGLFRTAARLDLDDTTGTTAGGLHLATMGGVWQALAYGFLGLRATNDGLGFDPCLPVEWDGLGMRLVFRGAHIGIRATHESVEVACTESVRVRVRGGEPQVCEPPGRRFAIEPRENGEGRGI